MSCLYVNSGGGSWLRGGARLGWRGASRTELDRSLFDYWCDGMFGRCSVWMVWVCVVVL